MPKMYTPARASTVSQINVVLVNIKVFRSVWTLDRKQDAMLMSCDTIQLDKLH